MDDVRDDVIIACPFETDDRIFSVWHKYFDATFVIAACVLILIGLVIYVPRRYQRTRIRVGFGQSSFTIRPMFPIIWRNVEFACASS